jgi:hypothetical protein
VLGSHGPRDEKPAAEEPTAAEEPVPVEAS